MQVKSVHSSSFYIGLRSWCENQTYILTYLYLQLLIMLHPID